MNDRKKLTAANCHVLRNAKAIFSAIVYKEAVRIANAEGLGDALNYLDRFTRPDCRAAVRAELAKTGGDR